MTVVSSGQISIINLTDSRIPTTQPSNPVEGSLWLNTEDNQVYIYHNNAWKLFTDGLQQQINNLSQAMIDLGDDTKITRFERSLIRGDIADITGLWLNPTDSMPSLSEIDAGNAGSLHALRKSAIDVGVDTGSGSKYETLGNSYTDLVTYLSSITPAPWDTSSTATITVDSTTWHSKWKAYYDAYNLLQIEVQDRQKAYADVVAQQAQDGAIAAVQNAVAHQTENIAYPTVINAPIATIGLPEFQGYHFDSWDWNGRNLLLNTSNPKDSSNLVAGANSYSSLYNDSVKGSVFERSTTDTTEGYIYSSRTSVSPATTYTFSCDIWVDENVSSVDFYWLSDTVDNPKTGTGYVNVLSKQGQTFPPGEWVRATWTFTTYGNDNTGYIRIDHNGSKTNGVNATLRVTNLKLEVGNSAHSYTQAPEESWATKGNRIQPVTTPIFKTGTTLTLNVKAYGDGTNNDSVYWDSNGNLVKNKLWEDVNLDDKQDWSFVADFTGYKEIKATAFAIDVANDSVQAVKHDGTFLSRVSSFTGGDQVSLSNSDNALYITIKDVDSGWGENYTPTSDEITAYFLGWKMCNGTYNTPYNGSGTKMWYPIGDTDLNRAFDPDNGVPTTLSPSLSEYKINKYQVVYRLNTPVQVTGYSYDGVLALIQGVNTVDITFPDYTPSIVTGTIKYATNLATTTQDLTYIIPTIQKRMEDAEQKITDEAIINTVTSSISYQTALAGKANASDLSNYASKGAVDDLSNSIDDLSINLDDLKNSLSDYATKTMVTTTADGIKEAFYKAGGMNLIYNSVGYDGLNFWTNYSAYPVQTIQNEALDNLGFGSGFYFKADGQNKGISQNVKVIPGQHYTLSWYLNKLTSGKDSTYRFFIQILEDGDIVQQIDDNSSKQTNGYEASYMTYIASPTATTATIRFIAYGNVEAYLTGVMFTIGDIPIKWTLATGESYNTNIRMNINGIRVAQLDDNGDEVGYTQITPSEFAGYHSPNNDGTFEKVFYLNGDETVTKKITATNEFTMGNVKIVPMSSTSNTGWAFISNN